jgi:hypothetical protein
VGIAETGSGKTLAFSLPGLQRVQAAVAKDASGKRRPRMLVVAPTRWVGGWDTSAWHASAGGGVEVVVTAGRRGT